MTVKVYVIDAGRKFYYLQYIDPATGKRVTRSSKETTRRGAERVAQRLENQLSSYGAADGRLSFDQFQSDYAADHLMGLAHNSCRKAVGVLETFARLMKPRTIGDIRAATLTDYVSRLRKEKRSEATISSHLGAIRAALRWAKDQGLIADVPKIPTLARSLSGRKMKGRPLTDAEFRQMLRSVRGIVGRPAARSWRHLLLGLWLSGLRLTEALALSWEADAGLHIDTTGKFPMLRVRAESEKGFRDRLLPLTPDFAAFVMRETDRTGLVFRPAGERGHVVYGDDHVGRTISAIGKAAGVIVDHRTGKTASAHDLRRSFGTRWARRVSPQVLMQLMRHQDIQTTMRYYVDLEQEKTASDLWERFGGPTQQ